MIGSRFILNSCSSLQASFSVKPLFFLIVSNVLSWIVPLASFKALANAFKEVVGPAFAMLIATSVKLEIVANGKKS